MKGLNIQRLFPRESNIIIIMTTIFIINKIDTRTAFTLFQNEMLAMASQLHRGDTRREFQRITANGVRSEGPKKDAQGGIMPVIIEDQMERIIKWALAFHAALLFMAAVLLFMAARCEGLWRQCCRL
eukprot:1905967-Rhodomonas_salina.1